MFCRKCGAEMADDAAFCPKCGTAVNGASAQAAAPVDVPNHMVWAVLSTVFCCLIGGIVAIVYSARVNTKLAQGDVAGAQAAARASRNWIIANVIFGVLAGIAQVAMLAVGVMQAGGLEQFLNQ